MQRLCLFCEDLPMSAHTVAQLERNLTNPVVEANNGDDLINTLNQRVFHVLIFRFEFLGDYELELVTAARTEGHDMPIIVIAERVKTANVARLSMLSNIHMVSDTENEKSIAGLTRKLLSARRVPQQRHPRYPTKQIAQVEGVKTGNQLLTCMYNLSKGGAYCEFEDNNAFTIGDVIRIRVNIDDTESEHMLNARVVWTTKKGKNSGRFGCGFKFIQKTENYSFRRLDG